MSNIINREFIERVQLLHKREIDLSGLPMTSRVFNYNKNKGIIDYEMNDPEGKRRKIKLNYFEAFWVILIQEFRAFGISDQMMRDIKDVFHSTEWGGQENKAANEKQLLETIEKLRADLGVDDETEIKKAIEFVKSNAEQIKKQQTFIAGLLSNMLLTNEAPVLVIHKNLDESENEDRPLAMYLEGSPGEKELKEQPKSSMSIRLPLKSIHELLFDFDLKPEVYKNYKLLNDKELEVIEIVRSGRFKSITIKPGKGEPKYEIQSNGKINNKSQIAALKRAFGTKNYKEVTVKFRNNDELYFEGVEK